MSRMLSKMNLISVVQQLPKEDIETIQGYVEMIEEENNVQKIMIENFVKENQQLKESLHQASIGIQELIEQDIEYPSNCSKLKEILNQQKEFIEYLESEIYRLEKTEFYIDSIQKAAIETHKHNLSKYREIIGESK